MQQWVFSKYSPDDQYPKSRDILATHSPNKQEFREREVSTFSFLCFFFSPQGSNGVQGQWNCVLVDFFFPRGDLPFPSLSLLRYIPLPLFITFQHRFGRQTKAALSCGDLACGSRTQRPGIAGLPSVSPR